MKPSLVLGATAELTVTVTPAMRPAFDGQVVHDVYSTWSLAHHLEIAARRVLAPHLEAHEEGIGTHLSIDHVAPTPVGHRVRIVAEAVELDPSTLICALTAYHVHPSGTERVAARGRQIQRILPRTRLAALLADAHEPG